MDLLEKIQNCSETKIDQIISEAIKQAEDNCQKEEMLGFCSNVQKNISHKGFISLTTQIRFSNYTMNSYSMKTTDYFYDFARYIKKRNITNKGNLIKIIENYINIYFGINTKEGDFRDDYFDQIAFQSTTTDEEYFAKLATIELGNLKGKNIAMCTERAAMAQNLLSLFGIDSYYCMGCVNNAGHEEPHCFNIAKAKDCYRLLDYSIPCPIIKNNVVIDYAPFQGNIEFDNLEDVMQNNLVNSFDNYEYVILPEGIKKIPTGDKRAYVVGEFALATKHPSRT